MSRNDTPLFSRLAVCPDVRTGGGGGGREDVP